MRLTRTLPSRTAGLLGLCLAALACAAAGASPAPAAALSATAPASHPPRAAHASLPGLPTDFFGDWLVPGQATALGAFSTATGHLERIIGPPEPFGGAGQPALAAGGKTVAWVQGTHSCGSEIESASTRGGPITVVVPDGPQHGGTPAFAPSYSTDGRYFSYATLHCDNFATFLHIRDLRTGTSRVYSTHEGTSGLVFTDGDQRVVSIDKNGQLAVAALPSLATRTYPPPAGCRYYHVTGTETKLVVAMDCGKDLSLSLVTLSTATFHPVGTPLRLGRCKFPDSLSIAPPDPSALLAEVTLGCHNSPTGDPNAALLEIQGTAVHQLLTGKYAFLPGNSAW